MSVENPAHPPSPLRPPPSPSELEAAIAEIGQVLWQRMQGEVPGLFNADFWQGKLLEWAMRDADFRVDLFRFVDVLPVLKDRKQVFAHLKDYLLRENRPLPTVLAATLKAASGGLTGVVAVEVIKHNLVKMAENFIVGNTPEAALKVLRKLDKEGIAFTADLLGEATLTAAEGDQYLARYSELIQRLAEATASWSPGNALRQSHLGPMPLANVSIKLSALDGRLDAVNATNSVRRLVAKLQPLFVMARQKNVALNLDLESWALHGITYAVFEALALDPALRDWPYMGVVVQAYLHEAPNDLERLFALARKRGAPVAIRLVKGAYWDYEVALAQQRGYPCPVLQGKAATDAQYESLSRLMLDQIELCLPAFGSHNLRSIVHALAYAEKRSVPREAYEVQMLYGMAEPERAALRERGLRVRVYAPVGELLPGMAYLVRRLLENTSNTGFLRQTYHEHTELSHLLSVPVPAQVKSLQPSQASKTVENLSVFVNCPLLDFAQDAMRERFAAAVVSAQTAPARRVPAVIGGKAWESPHDFTWLSPNDSKTVVTHSTMVDANLALKAVEAAQQAFQGWRAENRQTRAGLLLKLGDILAEKRFELAALQVVEVAKPWAEADADVAEAIDFCRYYAARASMELADEAMSSPAGESNVLTYQGRGVCAVIAPWNFPLAILTGMATAALVAGNTVVLKPAEQSIASGYALFTAMQEVGFPPGVVQFLPGLGEIVGPVLTTHPHVAQVAFTGSHAVGTRILRDTSAVQPGQRQFKRVICELGGKNAMVIDDDADLDEAVAGVARSAFGYAGQKCSAASRLFVVASIYDAFIARLREHLQLWSVLPATDPACDIPPVIDDESATRLREIIANPGSGAKLLALGTLPANLVSAASTHRFVPPALFEVDSPQHRLMQEEFFGPVLAVLRVESFDAALACIDATPYALTGGLYSRRPSHIAKARTSFDVGNLYVNRPCTGAVVGRQPFGGFGQSGLGTKAGGPGYLRLFADPRVISESTMRHGFTPETA